MSDLRACSVERYGRYMRTFTGVAFYPLDPRPEEVVFDDLAHHLSLLCRFCGAIKTFYCVGQHSVLVAEAIEAELKARPPTGMSVELRNYLCRWGLIHDASEAYTNDIVSPIKHDPIYEPVVQTEAKIMAAVCARFGLAPAEPSIVSEMDKRLCVTEAAQLRNNSHSDLLAVVKGYEPIPGLVIEPWAPEVAERRFHEAFARYGGEP